MRIVITEKPLQEVEVYDENCLVISIYEDPEYDLVIYNDECDAICDEKCDDEDKKLGDISVRCRPDGLYAEIQRMHMNDENPENKLVNQVAMLGNVISFIFDTEKFGCPILLISIFVPDSGIRDESLKQLGFTGLNGGSFTYELLHPNYIDLVNAMLESGTIAPSASGNIWKKYEEIQVQKTAALKLYSDDLDHAIENGDTEKQKLYQLRINALRGEGLPYIVSSKEKSR